MELHDVLKSHTERARELWDEYIGFDKAIEIMYGLDLVVREKGKHSSIVLGDFSLMINKAVIESKNGKNFLSDVELEMSEDNRGISLRTTTSKHDLVAAAVGIAKLAVLNEKVYITIDS